MWPHTHQDSNIGMLLSLYCWEREIQKERVPLLYQGLHPDHTEVYPLEAWPRATLPGWPQSSVRGQSWIPSSIPGSGDSVEWQGGNTSRPGSLAPSGIVGVKNYIQSGSIGHRCLHIVVSELVLFVSTGLFKKKVRYQISNKPPFVCLHVLLWDNSLFCHRVTREQVWEIEFLT